MPGREHKRQLILEKAFEAFDRYGLRKTTMDDIADGCGLRKASLYYYFKGKEQILADMIRVRGHLKLENLAQTMKDAPCATDALLALPESSKDDRWGLTLCKLAGEDLFALLPAAMESHEEHKSGHEQLIEELLVRGMESDEFVSHDAKRVARALTFVLFGAWLQVAITGTDSLIESMDHASDVFQLVLVGVTA